ncbi:MAG TPA: hydroxymethylbilane synthase [Stellaceae bacterium]|nr:hydroxymethylbilane synthase [Stellaceae bacterium]
MKLRVGTRRSALAQAQTHYIIGLIHEKFPSLEFDIKFITTVADKDRKSEFHQFGMTGVFSVEHEECLVRNEVDFVVHSLKDLPTTLMDGLVLAAVPDREDPRDAICGSTLAALPRGARIGTGSLRRRAQILAFRNDIEVIPIRGNVQPRLNKTKGQDGLDAVILAAAGLSRLGLSDEISETLDPAAFPYAVGQGALGVEARGEDRELLAILKRIEAPRVRAEVDAERAMMHMLGAGCSLPVGVLSLWRGDRLCLQAQVTSLDGSERIIATEEDIAENAEALGIATGQILRDNGAVKLLEDTYKDLCPHFKLIH